MLSPTLVSIIKIYSLIWLRVCFGGNRLGNNNAINLELSIVTRAHCCIWYGHRLRMKSILYKTFSSGFFASAKRTCISSGSTSVTVARIHVAEFLVSLLGFIKNSSNLFNSGNLGTTFKIWRNIISSRFFCLKTKLWNILITVMECVGSGIREMGCFVGSFGSFLKFVLVNVMSKL